MKGWLFYAIFLPVPFESTALLIVFYRVNVRVLTKTSDKIHDGFEQGGRSVRSGVFHKMGLSVANDRVRELLHKKQRPGGRC